MKAIGIVLAGGDSKRMQALSEKRAVPAMEIGCSYRCIDFVLSNMSNSNIQTVAVLSQFNALSLNTHLNSSKWWNFGRKHGGLFLFTPSITPDNSWWYRGTADAMWQNVEFLKSRHEPYVIIASGDCVYKMDFNDMLDYHIAKQADVTIACAKLPEWDVGSRYGVVQMDKDGLVAEFEEKPLEPKSDIVSAGVYILRRRVLIELLEQCNEEGRYNFVTDVFMRMTGSKRIAGYMIPGYWSNIASLEGYYRTNMDFLKKDVREFFFKEDPPIYSKSHDLPPAKYNNGADVKNSLVASGCIINGKVEDSLLFEKVFVGTNCVIKNSIILNSTYIGDDVYIENCIIDSGETLVNGSRYVGENGKIKVIAERRDRFEQIINDNKS